ncbi:MAG: hypothetical protein M3T96_06965 [Acidobacteriota bacterium]|nr:hypothetical protein [Acidobacteriota bacterium]
MRRSFSTIWGIRAFYTAGEVCWKFQRGLSERIFDLRRKKFLSSIVFDWCGLAIASFDLIIQAESL